MPSRNRQNMPRDASPAARGRRPASGAQRGSLWLYGIQPVLSALGNPQRSISRLTLTNEISRRLSAKLDFLCKGKNIEGEIKTISAINALLHPGAVHQGIAVATTPLPSRNLVKACQPINNTRNVVIVLDRITDPRNVGAIIRSAAAFSARAVVVPTRNAPSESGVIAKAASGALEIVPVVRVVNLVRALGTLADLGYWRIGLTADTSEVLSPAAYGQSIALILGAEGAGLRRLTRAHCDAIQRLPTAISHGQPSTLNVSTAAAIALYECARPY